ncbi:MAG: GDP-mannose 4,6-dehydratase [Phycisphaerales bacterium]|nr:GDP-mannose 4,6-dehydratase [Phycisphaerales bacterium]
MKTIFVTGAEGFVGSHLVQLFRQRGFDVVAGVRNRARKLTLEKRFGKTLVCDVSDAINVARAVASIRPDGVIHLAATSQAYDAINEPLTAYQSTVTAWANVLEAVRRSVPRSRVLFVSTCDVFGNAGRDGQPLSETTPCAPINTYGSLRYAAEDIAHTFFKNYHLNVSIARPFYHTGPGQPANFFYGAVAQRLATWDPATQGTEFTLPDLNLKRDLLHVHDVISAYERILVDGKPNETYHVASGQALTVREIVQTMIRVAGQPLKLIEQSVDSTTDGETIACLCGDSTKLRTELNWQPKMSWEDAVRDLVRSYQSSKISVPH